MVTTVSLRKPQHCKALLTVDQRIAFETALAAATTRQLRKACADYQALLDRLGSCPAITTAVRGALFDAYRKAQRDWTRSGSSDESALADRCRALTHDVTRMVAKPCRW